MLSAAQRTSHTYKQTASSQRLRSSVPGLKYEAPRATTRAHRHTGTHTHTRQTSRMYTLLADNSHHVSGRHPIFISLRLTILREQYRDSPGAGSAAELRAVTSKVTPRASSPFKKRASERRRTHSVPAALLFRPFFGSGLILSGLNMRASDSHISVSSCPIFGSGVYIPRHYDDLLKERDFHWLCRRSWSGVSSLHVWALRSLREICRRLFFGLWHREAILWKRFNPTRDAPRMRISDLNL